MKILKRLTQGALILFLSVWYLASQNIIQPSLWGSLDFDTALALFVILLLPVMPIINLIFGLIYYRKAVEDSQKESWSKFLTRYGILPTIAVVLFFLTFLKLFI